MAGKITTVFKRFPLQLMLAVVVIAGTAVVLAQVARPNIKIEAENGTNSANVSDINDSNASAGQAIQFSSSGSWDPRQTLPVGSALPSDSTCAGRVTSAAEIRPQNAAQNATAGTNKNVSGTYLSRVTGSYTGTTDQIIQWAACKWGIDVNIARAQAVQESYWTQNNKGDWTNDPSNCPPNHPLGADGRPGECPESYGMLQIRYLYHGPPAGRNTWPEAETSTSYNIDYMYAVWRGCYEGLDGWLNQFERGQDYQAGDVWGCVGLWFAGRWRTDPANMYIGLVQGHFNSQIWLTPGFINFRG